MLFSYFSVIDGETKRNIFDSDTQRNLERNYSVLTLHGMDGNEIRTVLGATSIQKFTCIISINTAICFPFFSAVQIYDLVTCFTCFQLCTYLHP